jgi:hypothetical protein
MVVPPLENPGVLTRGVVDFELFLEPPQPFLEVDFIVIILPFSHRTKEQRGFQ